MKTVPQLDNQLLVYYLSAGHQMDLNQHIPQEYKHQIQLLHKNHPPGKSKKIKKHS